MAIEAQMFSNSGTPFLQDLTMPFSNSNDNINIHFNASAAAACGFMSWIPPQQDQQQMMRKSVNNQPHVQPSSAFSPSVFTQIENRRTETESFINSQKEVLNSALERQRKHQLAVFMSKYESKIQILIKQKEEELAKATNRTVELHTYLRRMEIEKQTWQRVAQEKEAMVASLNCSIGRLRETGVCADDAESCCAEGDQDDLQNAGRKMVCKCCNSGISCIIVLPCRHLCLCRVCDGLMDSCPVCKMIKKASIAVDLEVLQVSGY